MTAAVNVSHLAPDDWEHAMVTGNGRQGVLCYGSPAELRLTFSHERLFLPVDEPLDPPDTGGILPRLRTLCHAGRFQQASDEVVALATRADGRYANLRQADPFVGAATLTLTPIGRPTGHAGLRPTGWRREVDFGTGVVRQMWTDPSGPVRQEVFVSRADDVVAVRLTGVGPPMSVRVRLGPIDGSPPVPVAFDRDVTASSLRLTGRCPRSWPGAIAGYHTAIRVILSAGGWADVEPDGALAVETAVVLLLGRTTVDTLSVSGLDELPGDFDELLRRHVRVHGELIGRCWLDLGGASRDAPTEDLLAAPPGPALVNRLFDAGRYAVISASGDLPPNLQGVWSGTYAPAWRGGYTLDGNLAAALSAAPCTGTPELLLPLFDLLDSYRDDFRRNAERLYRMPGILLPPHLTTHGRHNHFTSRWCLTFWTAGAAWMARLYTEYWRHTGDDSFLRRRALPFMREAAEFYGAFTELRDGVACFAPSYSPENSPRTSPAAGEDTQAAVNATMDVAAVRGLLRDLIELDDQPVARWQALLDRLPRYRVDPDGSLAEWLWPGLANNHAHRHASHLYGLWYEADAELVGDPVLRRAAVAAVRARLAWWRTNGDEMAFGLTQLGLAAAALDLADEALETLHLLAARYWRPNLVPTHHTGETFNIDVCGGLPAVVVAMLVRARRGRVDVLPALPDAWPRGQIEGVLLRDGLSVRHLRWSPGSVSVELVSRSPRTLVVTAPGPARQGRSGRSVHLGADATVGLLFRWDGR